MSRRLDWEKAAKRTRLGKHERARRRDMQLSEQARYDFAKDHELSCFVCGKPPVLGQVAKTGASKRGPWMVCVPCVLRHRKTSDPEAG